MILRKDRLIPYFAASAAGLFMGLYYGIVNTSYIDAKNLSELFITVKNPIDYNCFQDGFTIGIILDLIYIAVGVILTALLVNRNFKSQRYYLAVRYGSFAGFYTSIALYCVKLCVLYELAFDLGDALCLLIKFRGLDLSFNWLSLISIFNSAVILTLFSFTGFFASLVYSEKAGALISVILLLVCGAALFYLPLNLLQFDIVSWFYVKDFISRKDVFQIPVYLYYLISLLIFSAEVFVGYRILKKDTL